MKADRALVGLGLFSLVLMPLGCTAQAKKESKETASEVGRQAEKGAEVVKDKAAEAGKKIEKAAEEMAPKVDAVKQAADVKMALMADPDIDASKIDVDAEAATKTIHLKGTVASAAQKAKAERIAREKAAGYTIHNMLKVTART